MFDTFDNFSAHYKQTVEFFVMSVFAKCSFDHAIKVFLSFFQNVNLASINGC